MIVKEELLSKLRRYFSLNLYEARIWTALLSRGVSTAGELSDIGHVPRSRAYDVLESLEKKGYVVMKLGKPIKYIAVDPKEVVERVKKSIQVEANQNIDKLKELNIGPSILFRPLHLHSFYANTFGFKYGDFPVAEDLFERVVCLPISPKLGEVVIKKVAEAVLYLIEKHKR